MNLRLCVSCKKNVADHPGSVTFKCPHCGNYEIVRCTVCRKNATLYTCPGCGFKGPN